MKRILLSLMIVAGCSKVGGGSDFENATLVEGRGVEPDLVFGTTTLSAAKSTLGESASEPSTAGPETTVEAGPYRLIFVAPDGGGDPVLQGIRTARIPNPNYPKWTGKTSGGITFLDNEEKVRATYGQPAAEWHRSFGGRALYYTNGVILILEHPS